MYVHVALSYESIPQVPLQSWAVVVTRKDQARAMDFHNMMKRVGPPIGIEVGCNAWMQGGV